MPGFTESVVEQAALAWLESTGWQNANDVDISPNLTATEQADCTETVLEQAALLSGESAAS